MGLEGRPLAPLQFFFHPVVHVSGAMPPCRLHRASLSTPAQDSKEADAGQPNSEMDTPGSRGDCWNTPGNKGGMGPSAIREKAVPPLTEGHPEPCT